jgi:hypothetical protein
MATPKRKATDAPGNQQTTVKRSVLSSPSNKDRQQHVLSWFDKEDIELQVSRQIEKIKIQEVIQNIDNVTYYRDLEVAFGTFGTVEQQMHFCTVKQHMVPNVIIVVRLDIGKIRVH